MRCISCNRLGSIRSGRWIGVCSLAAEELQAGAVARKTAFMPGAVDSLLRELDIRPVLVEVGATGDPPAVWSQIAAHSTYVGIGAESAASAGGFQIRHDIHALVTPHAAAEAELHMTGNLIYWSLLEPHPRAIADFLGPCLEPAGSIRLPATTIDAVMENLSLSRIDWLEININGLDIPLFHGLSRELKDGVLALDSCLDLVALHRDQQSGIARYPEVIDEGFWLSSASLGGPIRMRQDSARQMASLDPAIDESFLRRYLRRTPGWLFVRFLRSTEWLAERNAPRRDWVLLWTFALLDGQFGFASDLLVGYEQRFGTERTWQTMQTATVARFRAMKPKRGIRSLPRRAVRALMSRWK